MHQSSSFLGEKSHQEVAGVTVVQQLAEEVEVGHERRLEDDGHVGRVEQLDRVRPLLSAVLLVLHLRDFDRSTNRKRGGGGKTKSFR